MISILFHLILFDNCSMELHIGKLIKSRLDEVGMKKSEFARRINRSSQNVYDIFERKSIDSSLLYNIGLILDFNFFEYISNEFYKSKNEDVNSDKVDDVYSKTELIQLNSKYKNDLEHCQETKKLLAKEITYLKEINTLLRSKIK